MPPEGTPSDTSKSSARITATEHFSDTRKLPRPSLATPSSIIAKAKQHAPIPSTNRTRPIRKEGAQQSAFLSILPHDVHYLLATHYIDFDTLLALRQTCRTMHGILTPGLVHRIRCKIVKDSLDEETTEYQTYRSKYPRQRLGHLWDLLYAAFDFRLIERPSRELRCYGCLEVKPLWCFVERMSNRGTGLGAKSAKDRMCKDCMRRFRDIEGEWWKENWVRKSDTVRKTSKSRRVRRFLLEGGSLVNPEEEIGVCSSCGSGTFELWWGCVSCFDLEEQRRREEDMMDFDGPLERKIVDFLESWRVRKEAKRRKKQASRDRRSRRWWAPNLSIGLGGNIGDRKAALVEWKDSKASQKPGAGTAKSGTRDSQWRALDQMSLPKSRREARCSSCWVPNCPRRTYILGLAYERPLPQERWCSGCQESFSQRLGRKEQRKKPIVEAQRNETLEHLDGIFGEGWDDGLGFLFNNP